MAIVSYNIVSGVLPVVAQLSGSSVPDQVIDSFGVHVFTNVELGLYTLVLTDANGCVFEREITVNPAVTTTTTTVAAGTSIVIGNTQDPITIFNPDATNRSSNYSGFPDANIVNLFLWFKTLDGTSLASDTVFTYQIEGRVSPDASTFEFVALTDQIHAEVNETSFGPISPLQGSIVLKAGFIETGFNYIYYKNLDAVMQITVSAANNNIYSGLSTKFQDGKAYGIVSINGSEIVMQYDD